MISSLLLSGALRPIVVPVLLALGLAWLQYRLSTAAGDAAEVRLLSEINAASAQAVGRQRRAARKARAAANAAVAEVRRLRARLASEPSRGRGTACPLDCGVP